MSEHNITVQGGSSVRLPTAGKYCDRDIVVTAVGGGTELPELDNPASEAEVFDGYEYIDGTGVKKSGTFTVEEEIAEQDSLIAEILATLEGKASGGGGEAPASPIIEPLSVTENGTYTAPSGVDGYSPVTVNVEGSTNSESEEVAALLGNTMTVLDNSLATSLRARACQGATKLVTVNLPMVTSLGNYAFYQCSGLVTVELPKLTTVSTQVFYGCTKLKHADCGQVGNIPAQTFNACSALTELILRKTNAICTLSNVNAINNTPIGKGTGYVYVPSALVDSYRAATNWSTFANQIRAIEDYPEITGG